VKSPTDITKRIEQRLRTSWHLDVAGDAVNWPIDIPIGAVPATDLTTDFSAILQQVRALRDWADAHGLGVRDGNRRVHGTTQPIPTHITVPDLDIAAAACGTEWTGRVARGRNRVGVLRDRYPDCGPHIAFVVRGVESYSDLDFSLLLMVADWFRTNTADGLTPRQVPVPGVNAKWLNTGQPIVEILAGRPLNLAPRHAARIHFVYLDANHLATGGRRFDSATVGDTMHPAYNPEVVVITENKDTAIHFPATPGGIAVEGEGAGGSTAARLDWLVNAPLIIYWGDVDADGFEILDGYRRDGVPAVSILMDIDTYRAYGTWGTFHYPNGQEISPRKPKDLANLTDSERDAYLAVCSPRAGLPPRIEQERIPLRVAHQALLDAVEAAAAGTCRTE